MGCRIFLASLPPSPRFLIGRRPAFWYSCPQRLSRLAETGLLLAPASPPLLSMAVQSRDRLNSANVTCLRIGLVADLDHIASPSRPSGPVRHTSPFRIRTLCRLTHHPICCLAGPNLFSAVRLAQCFVPLLPYWKREGWLSFRLLHPLAQVLWVTTKTSASLLGAGYSIYQEDRS